METLQDRVLPLAYGVAGRCVGLVQGACFALQTARDSLFHKTKEHAPREVAESSEEPVVASPEKKQRVGSPERPTHTEEKPDTHEKQAEPQQLQQEDPETEQQQEKLETDNKQAQPQQLQQEDLTPERQPEQRPEAPAEAPAPEPAEAPAAAAADAKPANGMPADPTPAEAAGAESQEPIGEVTRLEDVTGIQQPAATFVEAAAKPPGPEADIINNSGESSASENHGSAVPSSAATNGSEANTGSSKGASGTKKKKRSNSRKRKNGH